MKTKYISEIISKYVILLSILFMIIISSGCQSQQPIFPEHTPAITWPKGNLKPRYVYVGELTKAADLKPSKSWLKCVGGWIFGNDVPFPLYGPRGILVINDLVWVADPGGRCLHMFDLNKRDYKKITSLTDGGTVTIELSSPVGLCLGPNNSIFVCDSATAGVYQLKEDGVLMKRFHLQNDVDRPTSVCYISSLKRLYVLDTKNHDIKVYSLDGRLLSVLGKRGVLPGEFNFPLDIMFDGELLWVVDSCNARVQALTPEGKPVKTIGRFGKKPGDFALPKSLSVDSKNNIYVVDSRFENIQVFNRQGQLLMHLGHEGSGPGEFSLPSGIFIDSKDRIWICDSYNHRIQLLEPIREVKGDK